MTHDERMQAAIDAIRATPVSDDANAMLLYLDRCANAARPPCIRDIGWHPRRAELALIELTARGFIEPPVAD